MLSDEYKAEQAYRNLKMRAMLDCLTYGTGVEKLVYPKDWGVPVLETIPWPQLYLSPLRCLCCGGLAHEVEHLC